MRYGASPVGRKPQGVGPYVDTCICPTHHIDRARWGATASFEICRAVIIIHMRTVSESICKLSDDKFHDSCFVLLQQYRVALSLCLMSCIAWKVERGKHLTTLLDSLHMWDPVHKETHNKDRKALL